MKADLPSVGRTGCDDLGPHSVDLELMQLKKCGVDRKACRRETNRHDRKYTALIRRLGFSSHQTRSSPAPSRIRIRDYVESETPKLEGYPRLPVICHAARVEDRNICSVFVYQLARLVHLAKRRGSNGPTQRRTGFRSTQASPSIQIHPAFEISGSPKSGEGGHTASLLSLYAETTTCRPR